MATVPGFRPFEKDRSGGTKNYIDDNGEIISRRQFDKIKREITLGRKTTNEQLAKFNREVEPVKAAARPARGKSSLLKLPKETQAQEAARRIANEELRKAREKAIAEQKKVARDIERQRSKKVKTPKKITGALLTPGAIGRTIEFTDGYPEYLDLFNQAKKNGHIFGYTIGVDGIDTRNGRRYRATVFTLRALDRPIPEATFYAEIQEFLESKKSYFLFKNYAMHLAFALEYAKEKKERFGDKRSAKHRPGRKGKKKK